MIGSSVSARSFRRSNIKSEHLSMYSSDFKTFARVYTWLTIRLRSPWTLSLVSVKALNYSPRQ